VKVNQDRILDKMFAGAISWIKRNNNDEKIDETITEYNNERVGFKDYQKICYKELLGREPLSDQELYINDVAINYFIEMIVKEDIYTTGIRIVNTFLGALAKEKKDPVKF